ncbi:hypothetical protein RM530_04015 [Algiphilus sp. W345]|uniref:Uncharacterized protein n=1 Tax=Banduia mediterranea TaxID=3075609 RepID=A0ABU2WGY7_9GAMM|nr:hypothetical protein [Algiphilus sp. W345]MDT0496531.1 hypothetical protein [Algiphilus sp. W345]
MTITTQDIQLYQPEVLDDTPNGGGRMSPNQVVDGDLNNVFDDQSRFDRVTGRVSLRKGWMAVISENRTKLLGAHAILLQRALDPLVHVSMFGRDNHTDRRDAAQAHLEQYLAAGATLPYYPYDTQPEGALIVSLLTELANTPPAAGDVLVLSVEHGSVNVGEQQFVRCIKVEVSQITATVPPNSSTKTLQLLDITIDQPLRFDVPGENFGFTQSSQQKTAVRRTTLAGGKRYYSIHKIVEPITAGDSSCSVESILTPMVPAAQQETAIVDQQIGSDTTSLVAIGDPGTAGELAEAVRGVAITSNAVAAVLEHSVIPGSVTVSLRPTGESTGHQHVLTDNGRGVLVRDAASGASVPAQCAGTVDYRFGQIVVTGMSIADGSLDPANSTVTYRPAVAITDVQHTDGVEIDVSNRGLVWTRTLLPKPTPSALQIEYRALGRWITLRDRGDGTIAGSSGEGSGTINYATGSVNLTLGAEPDIGSHLLYGWGSGAHYKGPAGTVQAKTPEIVIQLDEAPAKPGTVTLEYSSGEDDYSATDDGTGGWTGDATGSIDYAAGEIRVQLTQVPASGASLDVDYQTEGNRYTETPTPGGSGGVVEIQLDNGAVDPRSIRIRAEFSASAGTADPFALQLIDDGAGSIVVRDSVTVPGFSAAYVRAGEPMGTINYSTGLIELDETVAGAISHLSYSGFGSGTWTDDPYDLLWESFTDVRYSSAGAPQAQADAATLDSLTLQLSGDDLLYGVQAASLWVEFNGRRYYDRNGVVYYRDSNGNEQTAGSIDYAAGLIILTSWAAGAPTGNVRGVLVAYGRWPMTAAFWRVPAEQVKSASFQATYTRIGETDPDQAVSDNAGDIAGDGGFTGTINYDTGVYSLAWAESEVLPELATYNAVAVQYLPLDPEIIGLDPVRLSADGRIPTVQDADVAVIHNTQTTALPNPAIAGQTYSTRAYISALDLYDADGERIPTDRYTWDKTTGDVTMANPLDLDDYTQPLTAHHRIEDMLLVTDAQLSGLVDLNAQLTHDYPADTSFLSTALPLGNELQASAYGVFSQTTWTDEWSDELIGTPAVGQYNATVAPIITTNKGAIRERWRVEFTSVTAFRVIGETVGQVGVGDTETNCLPINPATGAPYFELQAAGWSAGWNIGNQLRFNTEAAARPIWFNRCTLPGPLTDPEDRFQVELRGDAN